MSSALAADVPPDDKGGIPVLKSEDGTASLRMHARLHVDGRLPRSGATQLDGTPLPGMLLLRRARLEAEAEVSRSISARLMAEFGQGRVSLRDAWVELAFAPELKLRAGHLKVPFGIEWLTSSNQMDFIERSLMFAVISPQYDVGAALHGGLPVGEGEYWLGLFNGDGQGGFPDSNRGKMGAARLSFTPVSEVSLGVHGTYGREDGRPDVTGQLPTGFIFVAPGRASGPRWRLGAEVVSRLGPATLKAEYARLLQTRDSEDESSEESLRSLRVDGLYVSGVVLLTGERKAEVPLRPFDPMAGRYGYGAWEVGLRYSVVSLRPEPEGPPRPEASVVHQVTAGVNWYPQRHMRWMLDVSRYFFREGTPTPFTASPEPGRTAYFEVLTRFQVAL